MATYEQLGYDKNLIKTNNSATSLAGSDGSGDIGFTDVGTVPGGGTPTSSQALDSAFDVPGGAIDGGAFADLWISNTFRSKNYKPKTQGFLLDGIAGYIEAMKLYISGSIVGGSLSIPNTTSVNSWHVDSNGNMWSGAILYNIATNPFAVSSAGALRSNSGVIGGFTITSTELYGGIIKTAATVGVGTAGVIIDTAGLRGYDSVRNTFNLPTNGSAPTFSSGIINSTVFNINTNAVMRTSETVGDGTINSAGILINPTGFYACEASQSLADANVRILVDGSGYFSGTFEIGGATKTIDDIADLQTALDDVGDAGGGTVYLKAGTYVLTADITVPGGVTLEGVSRDGVIINCNSSYKLQVIGINAYSTGTVTINKGDIKVIGDSTVWTSAMVDKYIMISGNWYLITAIADNTHIDIDPDYFSSSVAGVTYVIADATYAATIKKITLHNATTAGIKLQYNQEITLDDLIIYDCGIGIDIDDSVYPKIIVTVSDCGVNMDFNNTWGWRVDWSAFTNSTTGAGIVMLNSGSGTFIDSAIEDNFGNGVSLTDCSNIAFISTNSIANGNNGIELISGCNDNQLIAFTCDGNTNDGVKFTIASNRNTVISSSIINNGGYGINITALTCVNNQINAPTFENNSLDNINDEGANTFVLPQDFLNVGANNFINNSSYTVANLPQPPTAEGFKSPTAYEY